MWQVQQTTPAINHHIASFSIISNRNIPSFSLKKSRKSNVSRIAENHGMPWNSPTGWWYTTYPSEK
jgi:hypothetical protein